MALIVADRVRESSLTTGTGAYALAGAVPGFRSFGAVCASGDTAYYSAADGVSWETGIGTFSAGMLARTTILASSNAGAAVNWGAGSKDIFLTVAAAQILALDTVTAEAAAALATAQAGIATTQATTAAVSATASAASASAGSSSATTAQAQASLAAGFAASAGSVVQQDLSGITVQALHRSPNAVTAMTIYDTSKDSDGGAWTEKCQHTSWWNETLAGKWLGAEISETYARFVGATVGAEMVGDPDLNIPAYWVVGIYVANLYTITNGQAIRQNNNNGASIPAPVNLTAGKTYRVRVTLTGTRPSIALATSANYGSLFIQAGVAGQPANVTSATKTGKVGDALDFYITPTINTNILIVGSPSNNYTDIEAVSCREVTALTTASSDYFQLSTDGRFYRLWRNLLRFTEQLDNAAWTFTGSARTLNFGIAPDGTQTSTRLQFSGVNQDLRQNVTVGAVGTASVWVKGVAGETLMFANNLTDATTNITLTGAWQRVTRPGPTSSATTIIIGTWGSATARDIEVWRPQLEFGSTATAYEAKAADGSTSEVFRGNKRDFPRLAGIVAEAGNVTLYDLTEPGRPMWMRFNAGANLNMFGWTGSGISIAAASVLNGILVSGGVGMGALLFNFPRDDVRLADWQPYALVNRRIADRNIYPGIANPALAANATDTFVIASRTVGALAMAVLPDAPVDPITGLRVPTIWVATASGISRIAHNGTVSNSTSTIWAHQGSRLEVIGNDIVQVAGSDPTYNWNQAWPLTALVSTVPRSWAPSNLSGSNRPGFFNSGQALCDRGYALFGPQGTGALALVRSSAAAPNRGLEAIIKNTFNTGWMTGDVRRCFLSDVDVGSVTGPELVTNGTFDTDTTGWTPSTANVTATRNASGQLEVTNNGAGWVTQTINTVAGKTYRLEANWLQKAGGGRILVGTAVGSSFGGLSASGTYSGPSALIFTATGGATFISLGDIGGATGVTQIYDNISVREFVADRSYKAASATIAGTLTRAQLASGTSLVGYSSWSAANYLREPYSADLDFGTGEWTASAWVNVPTTLPVNSFPVIGNPTSAAGWTNSSWNTFSTTGGSFTASKDVVGGAGAALTTNTIAATLGRAYLVTMNVSASTLASYTVNLSSGTNVRSTSASFSGTGIKTGIIQANAVSGSFTLSVGTSVTGSITVESISIQEVGPAIIFDRAHSSGSRLRLGVTATGNLIAEAFDGTTTRTVTTTAAYNSATWLKARVNYTTDGTLALMVNGCEVATARGTPLLTLSSRYNLLTWSEGFDNVVWSISGLKAFGSGSVANTTATQDPIGGNSAEYIQEGTSNGLHFLERGINLTSAVYTHSIYCKAAQRTWAYIRLTAGAGQGAYFNLADGTIGTVQSGITAAISSVGNGWYRCSVSITAGTGIWYPQVNPALGDNQGSYIGDGASGIYIWGAQLELGSTARAYQRVGAATDFDFQAPLTIGNSSALDAPFPGSIALLKLGATVPTPEQAAFMVEQEKQLFRTNAVSILPDSGNIVDMAYDDATDRWVAVSAANESYWTGLVRNSVTPVPAGSFSRIVAGSGVELAARITTNPGVDVSIPAYGLREELVKRGEAAARLSRELAIYDFVGGFTASTTNTSTAITSVAGLSYPTRLIGARISGAGIPTNTTIVGVSGTTIYLSAAATATATGVSISFLDFALPVGLEAKAVMSAGALRREGATADYTRLFDGFVETIRFGVAPGATAWVQIQATRGATP